jgi:CRISPR system Cascade subunit CasC
LSTFVDIHIIQTVPPANLNRDDTGSPKSARFGGVRRARVSSQAWKRAARSLFVDYLPSEKLSVRTRRLVSLLDERLRAQGFKDDDASTIALAALSSLGLKTSKKESTESQYLLFLGNRQIDAMVTALVGARASLEAAVEADQNAKKSQELDEQLKQLNLIQYGGPPHGADVALFGRMVADIPAINVDAATQVAHAISTHPVELEFDYFTAVDDLNPAEETGAGMIGTVEFNSATFYRYANVSPALLAENLGSVDEVRPTLEAFLHAWVKSIPSGHQTTFGHRTLPEFVLMLVRSDQPINLAGAFEEAVLPRGADGIAASSVQKLCDQLDGLASVYGSHPTLVAAAALPQVRAVVEKRGDDSLVNSGSLMPFDATINAVLDAVEESLEGVRP